MAQQRIIRKIAWLLLVTVALVPFTTAQTIVARDVISARRVAEVMVSAGVSVKTDQIDLLGAVRVSDSAGLRVVSVTDRSAGTVKVKLRCQNNRECLPFYVLVHGVETPAAVATKPDTVPVAKASTPKNVIRGGDHATLILESADARINLPVICLQSGMLGQKVRVTSADHRQFFDAEVVGTGKLKGKL
jgi:flagella basal body P-ring formation protein FlgA